LEGGLHSTYNRATSQELRVVSSRLHICG